MPIRPDNTLLPLFEVVHGKNDKTWLSPNAMPGMLREQRPTRENCDVAAGVIEQLLQERADMLEVLQKVKEQASGLTPFTLQNISSLVNAQLRKMRKSYTHYFL